MSGRLDIDESRYPIALMAFHGVFTDAYFDEYLAKLTEIARRPGTRALIYDIRDSGMVPAAQRRKQADWMARYELLTRAGTAGMAFVIDSPILRGILTAILWMSPMACPHTVVATLPEAYSWCDQTLRAASSGTELER